MKSLTSLRENNNSEWVKLNKNLYEKAKNEVHKIAAELLAGISKFDIKIDSALESRKVVARLNRDVRFSKDKSPFKTNFGIWICPQETKRNEPAYYLHIEPDSSFLAVCYWNPDKMDLEAVRVSINQNWSKFLEIIENPEFSSTFEFKAEKILKKIPKGYLACKDSEKFLKLTSYEAAIPLADDMLFSEPVSNIVEKFEKGYPLICFFRGTQSID